MSTAADASTCSRCERCTWNPGPDCGKADHPHCHVCAHCAYRHAGQRATGAPTHAESAAAAPLGGYEMMVIPQDPHSIELVSEPDWIVLRPADDLPYDALPAGVDGWWLDRRGLPASGTLIHQSGFVAEFTPTGRFEVREDGAVAEVYEVRP